MTMTKYYLEQMSKRLIEDVDWLVKEKGLDVDSANMLKGNIQAEKRWAIQKMKMK